MVDTPNYSLNDVRLSLENRGFAIVRNGISVFDVNTALEICMRDADDSSIARRGNSVFAIRNLLSSIPAIREMVSRPPYIAWPIAILGETAKPVHGVYFDKTADANWPVVWHQDVTIRVRERLDVPGYEARSEKEGAVHVLPPVHVSEQMLALRIHLDDASETHGALRVIPGSHRWGRLTNERLKELAEKSEIDVCEVQAGDVMLMRPLLVHASSACRVPNHRRVIHMEYAAFDLPGGMEWYG